MDTLASLQEFADFRGVALDTNDARAIGALEAASAAVRSYCGQDFTLASTDVILDGSGSPGLLLPQLPVVSVDYVATLGTDDAETEITTYHVDSAGILWRDAAYWPLGHQNIMVSYQHGYAAVPWDLKEAAMTMATRGLILGEGQTVSQEQIGTYVVTYADASGAARFGLESSVLDRYRYPRVA